MMRSVSEPSLGTIHSNTTRTITTSRGSVLHDKSNTTESYFGRRLWDGGIGLITRSVMMLAWNIWWQFLVIFGIIYEFVIQLLLIYVVKESWNFLSIYLIVGEIIFFIDWAIHMLHIHWAAVRLHIRALRRNRILLAYDGVSLLLLPIYTLTFSLLPRISPIIVVLGRWTGILRIYRLYFFFAELNETKRKSRRYLLIVENFILLGLMVHMSTCLWFSMLSRYAPMKPWHVKGYPAHVMIKKLHFDTYIQCFYYSATRSLNTIFGDSFPMKKKEKILTSLIMLIGFCLIKYWFIGQYAWELVLANWQWTKFADSVTNSKFVLILISFSLTSMYKHMLKYMKRCGSPSWLMERAKNYKRQLWIMKSGVISSNYLKKLPYSLQTEMIFDINVAYFHRTIVFRDTDEAFMRQLSLIMEHEMYLQGERIWSQGVVKPGLFCIKTGVIEVLSEEDDESPMIAFKEGTVMGEVSLFYSIPSKVTVKAATYVEIQALSRTDFLRAMAESPQMLLKIRNKIDTRVKEAIKRQKAIDEYDKTDSRLIKTRYRPMKLLKDRLADVEDEDPTFVDTSHLYYKDENNKRQAKFTEEYLELYSLSPNVTTIETTKIYLSSNFPWILEPDTSFTRTFDTLHFVIVLYVCIMAPIHAAMLPNSGTMRIIYSIVLACLVLNIYLQLTVCIIAKGVKKDTVREIAEVKMSTWGFYLDIISVFPVSVFAVSLDPNGESIMLELSKLTVVLQVWHIWDYMQKLKNRFESNIKAICLVQYLLILLICCYWSGCLLYLYSCPKKLCRESSWMTQLIFYETKMFVTSNPKHEKPMTSSLAFGTAVFSGSGTAEFIPGLSDLLLVVVLIVFGTYFNNIYFAKICCIFFLSVQRRIKFKESMRELSYFLTVNRVSGKIKARVKKFFTVQWYYNNAVSTEEIFKEMSTNVQQEILSSEIVEILLYCPLFRDCNRDFLQTVAANVKTVVLPDDEIVQHAADIGRDMYILQKGHCNILNHCGKVTKSIGPGSSIGVIEMILGLPKVYTVLTTTNCVLRQLEYTALVQSWSTFPEASLPVTVALRDEDIIKMASHFEEANPLTGRIDQKMNRIAQELKESFVMLRGHHENERREYTEAFEKLGFLRHVRYIFLPGCITPYGIFLKLWCALRLITAMYYIMVIPYNVAVKTHRYKNMTFDWVDLFLYVDIVAMSYVAYYNKDSLLITHPLLSLTKYLKGPFWWDVLSIFPFEQLFKIVNEYMDEDLCRINRLLLVTRISGAFKFWERDIMHVHPILVMFRYVPFAITFINFMTAGIFMRVCEPFADNSSNWIMVRCTTNKIVSGMAFEESVAVYRYFYYLSWVFEIFIGCGCTSTSISNTVEMYMVMLLQIVGFIYFAFMFGYIASTRSATSQALLEHTENTKDLENFLYQENVDPALTAKTMKYFEYVWKRTNGSNPQQICRRLNSALMEDTLVFMYEHALREVPLFGKVERSFIRVITQHLHEMYFVKGETVVQCRDLQRDVYIIYKGKVDVLNSYNEMVSCMGPGGMFGNFTGQPISCSEVSVYSSRSLDLLVLPSQTFFNLVKYYPKIQEPLKNALALSKDYILPITMDSDGFSSEEDSDASFSGSGFDSRSGSSRVDLGNGLALDRMSPDGQLSYRSSHSELSQGKSYVSVSTVSSHMQLSNLLRSGSWLYQAFGYFTSIMTTLNYILILYEIVTLNDCVTLFWIQSCFDIFFFFKVVLAMHQGYVNKRGDFVIHPSRCRGRYLKHKSWVWLNVLVNFPLEYFGFLCPQPIKTMHYLRANKLFRLVYMLEFYWKTAAELTNNLTTLQAMTTLFLVVLLVHSATCLWLLTMIATAPVSVIRPLKMHLIDEETPQYQWDYVTSFYFVVSKMTLTGGDEFYITAMAPIIIICLTHACGKMLAATIVATSIQVAYATQNALSNYERKTGELMTMLKNQGLSAYQVKKYWKYVQQLWVNERGRQLPVLLEQTPYVRRCDLMSAMFGHHLRNCYLFADTEEAFLRQLAGAMEYTVFFPGNYIMTRGDSEARMFWVASGMVAVVSVRSDLTETTHEILSPGDVFGILQGLSRGINHVFSYRAETNVSILSLSLDAWTTIINFFPQTQKIIRERSEHLFTQIAP